MSTAQVANSVMVGPASRVAQARISAATSYQSVDPLEGSSPPPARDYRPRYEEDQDDFEMGRRRRHAPFHDRSVRFSSVLVSREVGAAIMQAQAATANSNTVFPVDAERGIAVYEFNQALMGTPEAVTTTGISR